MLEQDRVGVGILPTGQAGTTAHLFFIVLHISFFTSTQVLNPCEVDSLGKGMRVGVGLHPPGSKAGSPLAACRALNSACRPPFKPLQAAAPRRCPTHPGELQLRAATKSTRHFTPRHLSVDEVLSSTNLLFFVSSVLLNLAKRLDVRVSFCTSLDFHIRRVWRGGGSPRWESSAAGGSTEPFPGLSGQ